VLILVEILQYCQIALIIQVQTRKEEQVKKPKSRSQSQEAKVTAEWPLSRHFGFLTCSPWYHFMVVLNIHFLKVYPLTNIDLYMEQSLLPMATRTMWFTVGIFRSSEGERELDWCSQLFPVLQQDIR